MEEIRHMDLESEDLVADRIEQLKELFPEVATEGDGSIDFEKLRLILGDEVDEGDERYAFTWPGKADAIRQAQTVSTATLRPCPEKSVNWNTTQNLYIEGDNLEVLKLLQRGYHGKVKMIYIDPPYNTGHDFVYHDSFGDSIQNYKEQARLSGQSNADTSGRYHSNWCSMMYPRLKLARELLSDEGVIFISIDEHELANLKLLCNEIFGETNFLNSIIWRYTSGGIPEKGKFSAKHDTILLYAKSVEKHELNVPFEKSFSQTIPEPHTESGKRLGVKRAEYCEYCGGKPGGKYREVVMRDVWTDVNSLFRNSQEKKMLESMGVSFDTQKPTELIQRMVSAGSNEHDIVMDFFSGSGTTGHAVFELNRQYNSNRKFILVQLQEQCGPELEASGYHNVTDIGEERIRRAGRKIAEEIEESNHQLKIGEEPKQVPDIGFRVLRLDESGIARSEPGQLALDRVKPDRTDEDIVFEMMLKWGIELTYPIEKTEIGGYPCYSVAGDALICCMREGLTVEAIQAIADRLPSRVLMLDSILDDTLKLNAAQIFKHAEEKHQVTIDLRTV